jgi:hypothetical protein
MKSPRDDPDPTRASKLVLRLLMLHGKAQLSIKEKDAQSASAGGMFSQVRFRAESVPRPEGF